LRSTRLAKADKTSADLRPAVPGRQLPGDLRWSEQRQADRGHLRPTGCRDCVRPGVLWQRRRKACGPPRAELRVAHRRYRYGRRSGRRVGVELDDGERSGLAGALGAGAETTPWRRTTWLRSHRPAAVASRRPRLGSRHPVMPACAPPRGVGTHPPRLVRSGLVWMIWFARASPECLIGALELGHLTTQTGQQFVVRIGVLVGSTTDVGFTFRC
jgi:hypothetical protein